MPRARATFFLNSPSNLRIGCGIFGASSPANLDIAGTRLALFLDQDPPKTPPALTRLLLPWHLSPFSYRLVTPPNFIRCILRTPLLRLRHYSKTILEIRSWPSVCQPSLRTPLTIIACIRGHTRREGLWLVLVVMNNGWDLSRIREYFKVLLSKGTCEVLICDSKVGRMINLRRSEGYEYTSPGHFLSYYG